MYPRNLNPSNALALDLGINNLVTAVSSKGRSFIVDGTKLKSINQWYNKENTRLQSIKDKQRFGKKTTNRQKTITRNRNKKVNDYMSKVAHKIINYCILNDIGTLVVGYNETFQRNSNIGKLIIRPLLIFHMVSSVRNLNIFATEWHYLC
ncbi:MAG: transposase [Anaerostipes hadrus]